METAAVIVAAGASLRMKAFKPMLQLAGSSVIRTAIGTLLSADIGRIFIITGKNADDLRRHTDDFAVTYIHNEHHKTTDMYHSARLGLLAARSHADRLFFLPVDCPLFSRVSLLTMMGYMDYSKCDVLIPTHNGKSGHPLLMRSDCLDKLLTEQPDGGLASAIRSFGGKKEFLEMPDAGLVMDADLPADYELLKKYARSMALTTPLTCRFDVRLHRRIGFFSGDTAALLEAVARLSSLSAACDAVRISYSNGWKSIKIAEGQLGFPLLETRKGGADGGGSTLTAQARSLLSVYHALCVEISSFGEARFHEHFSLFQQDS